MRQPTPQDIENPERLRYFLRDLMDNLVAVQNNTERLSVVVANKPNPSDLPPSHLLEGVSSPPEALLRLGVDQMATMKSNLTAVELPGATDDERAGYGPGSLWMVPGTSPPTFHICISASSGNAVWKKFTLV